VCVNVDVCVCVCVCVCVILCWHVRRVTKRIAYVLKHVPLVAIGHHTEGLYTPATARTWHTWLQSLHPTTSAD